MPSATWPRAPVRRAQTNRPPCGATNSIASQGGLFVWARLTGANGKVADGNEFSRRAIEQGVAFVPGAPFYCEQPDPATLRLSFATSDLDKIREGVSRLARALHAA